MGFFKSLFRLFSNTIECPQKFSEEFIYMPKIRRGKIKLGTTLLVKPNFVAVLATKGRVCEAFSEGKHKLTLSVMPKIARLPIFNKKPRKGRKPRDSFKGEVYFVNKNLFKLGFVGFESFWIKDDRLGKIKAKASGEFEFEVSNPKKFIAVCLLKWAYVKPEVVKRQLSVWVGLEVANALEKLNLPLLDFALNAEYISKEALPRVTKKFQSYGFSVKGLSFSDTSVPNKIAQVLYEEQEQKSQKEVDVEELNSFEQRLTTELDQEGYFYERQVQEGLNNFSSPKYKYYEEDLSKTYQQEVSNYSTSVLVEEDLSILNKKFKSCKNCFIRIDQNAGACYNCGASQESLRLCKNCGVKVETGEFVCPNCRSIIID